jgi:hypothetical protein
MRTNLLILILLFFVKTVFADLVSIHPYLNFKVNTEETKMKLTESGLYIGGNETASSNLEINGNIGLSHEDVSTDFDIGSYSMVLVDTSSGDVTLTLPYAGNVSGRIYNIKKISTNNNINITSTTLMDHKTNWLIDGLGFLKCYSNGQQWYVISSDNLK